MKTLLSTFALLIGCGLLNVRKVNSTHAYGQSCLDDHMYTYIHDYHIKLTCDQIRDDHTRTELCKKEEVQLNCKYTCGNCCEDDEDYFVNCEWIAKKPWRKIEYCGQTYEHRMVQEACPKACNYCFTSNAPSNIPSSFPSLQPSNEPSDSCKDDDQYHFHSDYQGSTQNLYCKYICQNSSPGKTESRKNRFCKGDILEKCCASCNSGPGCY